MSYYISDTISISSDPCAPLWIGFDDERFAQMKSDELDLILESYREMYPETPLKDVWMFFDELPLVEGWELFVLRVYKILQAHLCLRFKCAYVVEGDEERVARLAP